MSKRNIYSTSVRKRVAYFTAFQVFLSYYWLSWKSKIFGKVYYEKRINALHLKNADRVKVKVQELQGLFIKFGQLVSNLSNILPEEFRGPLEELQDHIESKPFAEIKESIEKELGKPIASIFSSFQEEALASASIGQVHRATLNGEEVVVKIQHKNIAKIAEADLEILKNLIKIHEFLMDMHGLDHTYNQVKIMIEEELDYNKEAFSMQKISKNLESISELNILTPEVKTAYSTKKILVSSYCEGVKIGNLAQIKAWGLNPEDLAKRLIELYCKMILVDGFYHADPHPGNILVNEKGQIILLDFGAVAYLEKNTKEAIPELIEALVKNNTEDTVLALKKLGFIGSDKASLKFVEKLVGIFKEFLENDVELDGLNFQNVKLNAGFTSITSLLLKVDLRDVSSNIRIPKDYILLNRTIVLLMGNSYALAPELNALDVVRPYMKKQILDKDTPYTEMLIKSFKSQLTTAISLPNDLSNFLRTAQHSEVEDKLENIDLSLNKLLHLAQLFFYAFVLAVLFYFKFNFWNNSPNYANVFFYILVGVLGLVFFKKIFFKK